MFPEPKVLWPYTAGAGTSATNAATATSSVIDTQGYDFAAIAINAGTQSASTQAGSPSVLKIQEADNTSATSFVDIVGFRGGSATATNVDFVVGIGSTATAATSVNNTYQFNVDCRARKRYLSIVASPTTTQVFNACVMLLRAEQAPTTATKANVLNLVEG